MNSQNPVGENRPPVFPVAQNQVGANWQPLPHAPKSPKTSIKEKLNVAHFTAGKADAQLCVFCLLLGFLAIRWLLWYRPAGLGWGAGVFCLFFAVAVLVYARRLAVRASRASWYWLGIMLLCSLCYVLWPANRILGIWQQLLMLGASIYWCGSLFGVLLQGKTGNFLLLDIINLAVLVPIKNFVCIYAGFTQFNFKVKGRGKWLKSGFAIFVGIIISVPVLLLVLPLLIKADESGFGKLVSAAIKAISSLPLWDTLGKQLLIALVQLLMGIPLCLYIYGLLAGAGHKRNCNNIDTAKTSRRLAGLQLAQRLSILVVMGLVCLVYVVFIACQVPYFFSAFAGVKPQQYAVYSAYARQGFFQLCWIATINLCLMVLATAFCKKQTGANRAISYFTCLLCALTLLVIATAFSKMWLYIAMHGLTPKRIITCVFMVFLAGLCIAAIVRQFCRFSVLRFAAAYGAGLLCALCLCNIDSQVLRYNKMRYEDQSLDSFNAQIVLRAGPAGVASAMQVYAQLQAGKAFPQTQQLAYAIVVAGAAAQETQGTPYDNLTNMRVRQMQLPVAESAQEAETRRKLFYQTYSMGQDE